MNFDEAQFLLSPEGREVTAAAVPFAGDTLAAGKRLRRQFPGIEPNYLSSAVELVRARIRGRNKFSRADEMFFTRESLEQATDEQVSRHRAERFRGLSRVCDACCRIGGDAIALGAVAGHITCVDRDSARLVFCGENLRVYGIESFSLIEADILDMRDRLGEYDALFIDPSRRRGGKRTRSLDAMEPPFDDVVGLLKTVERGAVKLPPAAERIDVPFSHEMEWISTRDGLKEAVVWTGAFCKYVRFYVSTVTVTALHHGATLCDTELPDTEPEIVAAGTYLYEPDPALIRSGLLGRRAAQSGMSLISENIAYMTANRFIGDPFFRGYRVLRALPFSLKRLARALNEMNAGTVTVKKRGFPMLPEEVIAKLHPKGSEEATIILTKELGRNRAFIVEPM